MNNKKNTYSQKKKKNYEKCLTDLHKRNANKVMSINVHLSDLAVFSGTLSAKVCGNILLVGIQNEDDLGNTCIKTINSHT
jgi:hypothetical protein